MSGSAHLTLLTDLLLLVATITAAYTALALIAYALGRAVRAHTRRAGLYLHYRPLCPRGHAAERRDRP